MKHLTKYQTETIRCLHRHIEALIHDDKTGHDFGHVMRVVSMAKRIATDDADLFVVLCTAYLHEFLDDKMNVFGSTDLSILEKEWELNFEGYTSIIFENIASIGYKGGFVKNRNRSLEAKIVSDSDLLDAMGAIGIARVFYYAGFKGLPFHDEALDGIVASNYDEYRNGTRNAIAHFDEKILHLYDALETDNGKKVGAVRHERLLKFYHEFYEEIRGES